MSEVLQRMHSIEKGYVLDNMGLDIHKEHWTRKEWEDLGREIYRKQQGYQWALIDWLMIHRGDWGERYTHAAQITGLSPKYLSQLYAVGQTWPRDRRIPGLSVAHHKAVISLPDDEQRPMLLKAQRKQLDDDETHELVAQANEERWKKGEITDKRAIVALQRRASRREMKAERSGWRVQCPHCNSVFSAEKHKVAS